MQHRQVAVIGKGDVVNVNSPFDIFQCFRVGLVLHIGLRTHNLHKSVQAREAVGEQLREIAQLAHGIHKGRNIQVEGDEIPVVHLATHDVVAAEAHDNDVQQAQKKFHAAVKQSHGLVEFPLGGLVDFICRVEPADFRRLVGKCLGGADTGQAALNLLIDVARLFLGAHRGPGHPPAHSHGHRQKHRDGHRHHQRQLPPNGQHHRQGTQNGQAAGEQVLRAVVGKLRQLEQVGGQPGHELAGAVAVVVVKAQLLHMGEQVRADVRLHPDAEGMAVVGDYIVEKRAQHIAQRHRQHDEKEGSVELVGKQVVQSLPGNQREGQINGGNTHGTAQVDGKQALVIAEVMEEDG